MIRYTGSEAASASVWYPRKEMRDREAREMYFNLDKRTFNRNDTYIFTILDKELKADDIRI